MEIFFLSAESVRSWIMDNTICQEKASYRGGKIGWLQPLDVPGSWVRYRDGWCQCLARFVTVDIIVEGHYTSLRHNLSRHYPPRHQPPRHFPPPLPLHRILLPRHFPHTRTIIRALVVVTHWEWHQLWPY